MPLSLPAPSIVPGELPSLLSFLSSFLKKREYKWGNNSTHLAGWLQRLNELSGKALRTMPDTQHVLHGWYSLLPLFSLYLGVYFFLIMNAILICGRNV